VAPVFQRFMTGFMPRLSEFRSQIVHNDLNLHNLLVDPRDESVITGCLDFGDMVETPLIIDLAIAAFYQSEAQGDPIGSILVMARAFHTLVPLTAAEQQWLVDLVAMRAAMTITISHWRARKHPQNRDYLLRNEPAARAFLIALAGITESERRHRIPAELGGSGA
jgi:hydroxylysine kinase